MGWFIFWMACACGAGFVASSKNRGGGKWFFIGLLIGPLAILIVGLSAPLPATEHEAEERGNRLCPYCAEEIRPKAIVCKHCGRDVPPGPPSNPDPDMVQGHRRELNMAE